VVYRTAPFACFGHSEVVPLLVTRTCAFACFECKQRAGSEVDDPFVESSAQGLRTVQYRQRKLGSAMRPLDLGRDNTLTTSISSDGSHASAKPHDLDDLDAGGRIYTG
jgi:hypothetical protein